MEVSFAKLEFTFLSNQVPCSFFPALPDQDPVITGGKARYSDGEVVDMNCTSGRAKPAIDLTWYINGDAVSKAYTLSNACIIGLKLEKKNTYSRSKNL